jgi:hypothetical protein
MPLSKRKQHYLNWQANVARWRLQYKLPLRFDLTTVDTFRKCVKCGGRKKLTRHHKGHEYVFATIAPDTYAKRYIEFRQEDIVLLCLKCHEKIHKKYNPVIGELFSDLNNMEVVHITEQFLEDYRSRLIKMCDIWLKRKVAKK